MPDDEQVDQLPKLLADIDQAIALMGERARYERGAYEAYVEAGFTEGQALYLTAQLMKLPSDDVRP